MASSDYYPTADDGAELMSSEQCLALLHEVKQSQQQLLANQQQILANQELSRQRDEERAAQLDAIIVAIAEHGINVPRPGHAAPAFRASVSPSSSQTLNLRSSQTSLPTQPAQAYSPPSSPPQAVAQHHSLPPEPSLPSHPTAQTPVLAPPAHITPEPVERPTISQPTPSHLERIWCALLPTGADIVYNALTSPDAFHHISVEAPQDFLSPQNVHVSPSLQAARSPQAVQSFSRQLLRLNNIFATMFSHANIDCRRRASDLKPLGFLLERECASFTAHDTTSHVDVYTSRLDQVKTCLGAIQREDVQAAQILVQLIADCVTLPHGQDGFGAEQTYGSDASGSDTASSRDDSQSQYNNVEMVDADEDVSLQDEESIDDDESQYYLSHWSDDENDSLADPEVLGQSLDAGDEMDTESDDDDDQTMFDAVSTLDEHIPARDYALRYPFLKSKL